MGMILTILAAALLGSAAIVTASRRLADQDDAAGITPPSFIAIGDEP